MITDSQQDTNLDISCVNPRIVRANTTQVTSRFSTKHPLLALVISHTGTSEIPGITVAGANPELVKRTPAADSEFLYYGHCKCIDSVPATPDGKPTPAIITRGALSSAKIPLLVIDAGAQVKPSIPFISFGLEPGKNILHHDAMDRPQVEKAFSYGVQLGRQLAFAVDLLVIGESIPAGTTTALATLSALGIDAKFKVSSSMPENPHELKNNIVTNAMQRSGISFGQLKDDPIGAVSALGDPMIPTVAGIAVGAIDSGTRVLLAGGTQMCTVLAILKSFGRDLNKICIGTTSYLASDATSNIAGLLSSISNDVPILAANLHLAESSKAGLQAFAKGFVKDGAGAGGSSIAAMLKSNGEIDGRVLLSAIEKEYELSIEKNVRK